MIENIGPRLQQLRERAGYSQLVLATMIGVASNTISRWERGDQEPPLRLAAKLARALNCTVDALLQPAEKIPKKALPNG